jgi:hypothetical protein
MAGTLKSTTKSKSSSLAEPKHLIRDRAYDKIRSMRKAPRRDRNDRAAPHQSQQAAYARSAATKPLHATMAR